MSRDKRVDAFIAKAQPFAKPILTHLRELIHKTCPDAEETLKWGMPSFMYMGEILCGLASFKQHAILGFWKHSLLDDPKGVLSREGMGSLGKVYSIDELPSDRVIQSFIKQAMKLNEAGVKVQRGPQKKATELEVPKDLSAALRKNKPAAAVFKAFSPSAKNEYITWLEEAKTEATRTKRLDTAIEWISEGKQRHWKYQKK
jgi:uncharacterized protein YdeI (YjbR/CyaY-like superfamily)